MGLPRRLSHVPVRRKNGEVMKRQTFVLTGGNEICLQNHHFPGIELHLILNLEDSNPMRTSIVVLTLEEAATIGRALLAHLRLPPDQCVVCLRVNGHSDDCPERL